MYDWLVRVATQAPGQFLVELCRIFSNRHMSTGICQLSGEMIGALNIPQPRASSNMRGGDRVASKAEGQKVLTSILNVPE